MAPRTYQTEQLVRLQASAQSDLEVLEDLRDFARARAKLENDYATALQKLAQSSLSRRRWPDPRSHETNEHVSSQLSYKLILENAEKIAAMHLKAGDSLNNSISEKLKPRCKRKQLHLKKCADAHSHYQERFHQRQRELNQLKKCYDDQARIAQYQSEKFIKQEEGLKQGKKSFKTITKSKNEIEERVRKQGRKTEVCQQRATKSRNEYLLGVTALNAQHKYYTEKTLPEYLSFVNEDHHSQIQEYFTSYAHIFKEVAETEVDFCDDVTRSAAKIDKEFEESCLLGEDLFQNVFMVQFSLFGTDTESEINNNALHASDNAENMQRYVNQRAMAQKKATERAKVIESTLQMAHFQTANIDADPSALSTMDEEIAIMQSELVEAEWEIVRNDSRISALENAGVPVPEETDMSHLGNPGDDQRSLASWRTTSGVSLPVSDNHSLKDGEIDNTSMNSLDDDEPAVSAPPPRPSGRPPTSAFMPTVLAAYQYEATADDELTMHEGQPLVEESADDGGWTMVRNDQGKSGLVPTAYLVPRPAYNHDNVHLVANNVVGGSESHKAVAIYDYDGEEESDLTFAEGDIILVTQFDEENGDGYWRGTCNGKEGVFPSMLVELEE
eukprot:CFRG0304T1